MTLLDVPPLGGGGVDCAGGVAVAVGGGGAVADVLLLLLRPHGRRPLAAEREPGWRGSSRLA